MLAKHSLSFETEIPRRKPTHLTAIGSILGGRGDFDTTVWGSGLRCFSSVMYISRRKFYQKLDIRVVRGPVTQAAFSQCGINCPEVYGDPAVLMPIIYTPIKKQRKGIVLITHFLTDPQEYESLENITVLDIKTKDFKGFIDVIASAEKVISSSLHGIILSETYGTPAVFLKKGIETEMLKFYDWYYSTGRYSVQVAADIDEALKITPMPLPNLENMQNTLIRTFPYDLWECR
jgi:pyruvyltransferase